MFGIVQRLMLLLLIALPVSGGAVVSDGSIKGEVSYLSHEKGSLLKGEIRVRVFQDSGLKKLIAERKFFKLPKQVGPYSFEIGRMNIVKGAKWEGPFYIFAEFGGVEPLPDDPSKGWEIYKKSMMIGPLKGGEKNLNLFFD